MDSAAAFTRSSPTVARPEQLLRAADHGHHRTIAFWDSFDESGPGAQRWTDAAIAASRAGAAGHPARPDDPAERIDGTAPGTRAS